MVARDVSGGAAQPQQPADFQPHAYRVHVVPQDASESRDRQWAEEESCAERQKNQTGMQCAHLQCALHIHRKHQEKNTDCVEAQRDQ